MKVRALTSFGDAQGSYAPGEVYELPDGADHVTTGLAEPVDPPKKAPAKKKAPKK